MARKKTVAEVQTYKEIRCSVRASGAPRSPLFGRQPVSKLSSQKRIGMN